MKNNLPTEMNAIVIEQLGGLPILKRVPVPIAGPNQVVIKVDSSPINPSDLLFLKGKYGSGIYPSIAGIEGAGVVVTEGELYAQRVSFVTSGQPGSYADYAVAQTNMCIQVEDNISLQQASSSFINPVTVIGMLDVVQKASMTAVVHTAAASQLGRMMVRYFQDNGVKVINVVRRKEQVDLLISEGAEFILNQNDPDFFAKLTELATKLNAKICFEAIGGDFTGKLISALPNNSIIYIYGNLSEQDIQGVNVMDLIVKNTIISSFNVYRWLNISNQRMDAFNKVRRMLGTHLKSNVAMEFRLEQFDEALKFYQENMSLGKVLIRPSQ